MCGRYFVDDGMERELKNAFQSVNISKFQAKAGDVHPTELAFILTGTKEICLTQMRWGFRKKDQKDLLINARVETVKEKPMFNESIRYNRCVIPASGFYEWNKIGEKASFRPLYRKVLFMAGIWQKVENENQFAILTTVPNASVAPVHDRMPLVLDKNEVSQWLTDWERAEKLLTKRPALLERRQEFEQLSLFE
ncbi:SOS response-associated peptidase [Clostridium sp. AM16-23]|nr:SOS response-associated peptidase [Clostridium sp. AM16-23]RHO40310.1 SOS response-associated peptidase [Clostridium sp. AM16-23]